MQKQQEQTTPCQEIKQSAESEMTQMFKLSENDFKMMIISMVENVENMHEQLGNLVTYGNYKKRSNGNAERNHNIRDEELI